jgi:glucose/arabinose dehydrogenase
MFDLLRIRLLHLALLGLILIAACSDASEPVGPEEPVVPDPDPPPFTGTLALASVATGLSRPLGLTSPPEDSRLFIVEQSGRVRIIKNGAVLSTPFLDLRGRVQDGGEQGLLGLAFHPQYRQNRYVFVNYTADDETRISRFTTRTDDPDRADPASERVLLRVAQPFPNHNGGHLAFAPDGMLWIGMGDGGSAGDPRNDAQNRSTLLGAMLRIDVDRGTPYAIPPNNPFAGGGGRGEIWSLGLRNPWRWSFDRVAGLVYIADVGQDRREEVNVAPIATAGVNYGWRTMEGTECFNPSSGCNPTGLHLPVLTYGRSDGCSITGGHVYRGAALPALRGHYFYGDVCQGWIRSFRFEGGQAVDRREWFRDVGQIFSFGEDAAGELYVLTADGRVRRIVAG